MEGIQRCPEHMVQVLFEGATIYQGYCGCTIFGIIHKIC